MASAGRQVIDLTDDSLAAANLVASSVPPPRPPVADSPVRDFLFDAAEPDSEPNRASLPADHRKRHRLIAGTTAAILLAAGAGVGVVVATSGGGTHKARLAADNASPYLPALQAALSPVVRANSSLTTAVLALTPGGSSRAVKSATASALAAVQTAGRAVTGLHPAASDQALSSTVQAALSTEAAWLNAVTASLDNPSSSLASQLGSLGVDAQTKLAALVSALPAASTTLPDASPIVRYVQAANSAATTTSALRQFDTQIQSLLTQSQTGFTQINQLFQQMQTAADGGYASISLAQAEQTISTVVSNRSALAASVNALSAPTPLAASVRSALATALTASLTDDQDINNCLNEANDGSIAVIFHGCLNDSSADSQAASNAKQQFLSLYNQLRSQIGLPATSQQF